MALVSCAYVGDALTNWLESASVEQRLALCAALDCGPTAEQVAAVFLDCASQVHIPGNTIPTCQQMNDAIAEALEGLGFNFASDGTVGVTGDGSVGNPFKLDVKISGDSGNRLEVRNGALGVFDTAPPNLAIQYISYALGNDANAGTREAPLKTMTEATRRVNQETGGYGTFYFNVRANETHVLDQYLHQMPNAELVIQVYDDPIYGDRSTDCEAYYSYFAPNLSRPVFDFRSYTLPSGSGTVWPLFLVRKMIVQGVDWRTPIAGPTAPGGPHWFTMEAQGNIWLAGSNVHVRKGLVARCGSLTFQGVQLALDPGGTVIDGQYGTSINTQDIMTQTPAACGGKPSFTERNGNVTQVINPSNVGLPTDPATKTMFGFNATWDIFA